MSQCVALKKDLERCQNHAEQGSVFCRRHRWWWFMTFLGGIIAVTTIGANISQMFGITFPKPLEATATFISTQTLVPTLPPTTFIETPTITATYLPHSTEISTPTPSLTPFTANTLYEDTFIDNQNNWYVESVFPNITGGKYTHKLSCPSNYGTFYCEAYVIKIPYTFPKNFRMEIDTTILQSSINAHIAIGFQIRRNDDANYYYINYFIPQGFYQFKILNKGIGFSIIPNIPSPLIKDELHSTNRFGIEIKDFMFTPIINDQKLDQVEDGNLTNAGDSYLTMIIARGESAILQLDNLIVQEVH